MQAVEKAVLTMGLMPLKAKQMEAVRSLFLGKILLWHCLQVTGDK